MSKPSSKPRRRKPTSRPANDDAFVPPDFEPVGTRVRWDGWTAQRQSDFIQALAESGCVAEACRSVGMSERSAYALRGRADAVSFRNAWDAALAYAIRRLSDAVLSRAIHGVGVPQFFRSEQIGEKRYYDERLAMFLLRFRDPLHYGKWLERRDFSGHPEAAAMELAAARRAVREDADLSIDEIPSRVAKRHSEIAGKMHLAEQDLSDKEPPTEAQHEGDVP